MHLMEKFHLTASSVPLTVQYSDLYQNMQSQKCHSLLSDASLLEAKSSISDSLLFKKPGKSVGLTVINVSSPSKRCLTSVKKVNPGSRDVSMGRELNETATLSEILLLGSREWFLRCMEYSLNVGFALCRGKPSEIAGLLGQLKRMTYLALWLRLMQE
ncbi:hypothetical protein NC651_002367 [Populus alba x Populus x berolinensis]|nr:hypothetical protein NC651_002367 [Populus alba x Populus x berolinensis]